MAVRETHGSAGRGRSSEREGRSRAARRCDLRLAGVVADRQGDLPRPAGVERRLGVDVERHPSPSSATWSRAATTPTPKPFVPVTSRTRGSTAASGSIGPHPVTPRCQGSTFGRKATSTARSTRRAVVSPTTGRGPWVPSWPGPGEHRERREPLPGTPTRTSRRRRPGPGATPPRVPPPPTRPDLGSSRQNPTGSTAESTEPLRPRTTAARHPGRLALDQVGRSGDLVGHGARGDLSGRPSASSDPRRSSSTANPCDPSAKSI